MALIFNLNPIERIQFARFEKWCVGKRFRTWKVENKKIIWGKPKEIAKAKYRTFAFGGTKLTATDGSEYSANWMEPMAIEKLILDTEKAIKDNTIDTIEYDLKKQY